MCRQSIKLEKEAFQLCCMGNPSGFAEIVSDDFPVFHTGGFCPFRALHGNDKVT
jgi:hypothetical protein